jgi:hypothetical protein
MLRKILNFGIVLPHTVCDLYKIIMSRMLMFMHHIALCIPCIALFNCGHLLHIR